MENYSKGAVSDVSWRDMLSQDPYFWMSNSFQYSENINCDDELHGIKLSQKILSMNDCANCQLISAGNGVFALPLSWGRVKYITYTNGNRSTSQVWSFNFPTSTRAFGVVFQDYFRFTATAQGMSGLVKTLSTGSGATAYIPYDHVEDTDESIASESTTTGIIGAGAGVILNYNNSRLVVGVGNELRVYYPELDLTNPNCPYRQPGQTYTEGKSGWKKVQTFEWGSIIVGLTCTFSYLKVRVQDEWWNTKVFFYQGNNDLRNTFVYDLVDLTGTKVLRVYGINGIDYYTASLDGTDGYITFNKLMGNTPMQIFKQRGGLTKYDINQKAWYFVWPTSIDAGYLDGNFYVADAYGVFKFAYNPQGNDIGYMKRKIRDTKQITPWLCIYKNFVLVSDQSGLKMMRLYDTGIDGYEAKGILISREMEWSEWGCYAKILDEIRCHFELNNVDDAKYDPGSIDVYVSPNNLRRFSDPESDDTGRYHVMHLDETNINTRFEQINSLNRTNDGHPAFEFDRETITYCIILKRGTSNAKRTPIVRELALRYHTKGKTNNIYEIN